MRARRAAGVVALATLAACAPEPVTTQGEDWTTLWRAAAVAAVAVAALVWLAVIVAVLRYRRRSDDTPSQHAENTPLEIAYFVVPLIIVAVLFAGTIVTQRRVTAVTDDPDLTVEVTGFQWQWQFRYVDTDVVVRGDADTVPELVVPVGRTVRFELETADVIHSFWVPDFLDKRDLIPGVDNEIEVEITEAGVYDGRCAEFCGLDHCRMNFTVRAVPADEFGEWLEERRVITHHARPTGLLAFLTTTDHKRIGISYMVTAFVFFLVGGALAELIRAELQAPDLEVVSASRYNELFTMHGSVMLFLFLGPFAFGLANYLVPLHIGAPDMAFPRLNALSYWFFLFGGLTMLAGFLTADGAADFGWTGYAPLSDRRPLPGRRHRPVADVARPHRAVRRADRGQHRRHRLHHAGARHDDVPHADLHLEHGRDERPRAHRLPGAHQRGRRCSSPTATSAPTSSMPPPAGYPSCGSTCSGSSATPRCTSSCCRTSG